MFCSPSPSFCLASSNETPNELEHVLAALFLSLASLVSRPLSPAFPSACLSLVLPADFSIAPLPPHPLFLAVLASLSLHLMLPLLFITFVTLPPSLLFLPISSVYLFIYFPVHLTSSYHLFSHLSFPPPSSSTDEERSVRWRCCLPAAVKSILIA